MMRRGSLDFVANVARFLRRPGAARRKEGGDRNRRGVPIGLRLAPAVCRLSARGSARSPGGGPWESTEVWEARRDLAQSADRAVEGALRMSLCMGGECVTSWCMEGAQWAAAWSRGKTRNRRGAPIAQVFLIVRGTPRQVAYTTWSFSIVCGN